MKKTAKYLVLILWMAFIFFMSAQPAADSEVTSGLVTDVIYKLLALILGDHLLLDAADFSARYMQPIRKLAHFTEFMILGLLAYSCFEFKDRKKRAIWALVFSAVYALSDEIHQLFVLNRYCSVEDVLIDTSGAVIGIFLCHLIGTRWKKD